MLSQDQKLHQIKRAQIESAEDAVIKNLPEELTITRVHNKTIYLTITDDSGKIIFVENRPVKVMSNMCIVQRGRTAMITIMMALKPDLEVIDIIDNYKVQVYLDKQ